MKPDLTPVEARGGVISGRIIIVLIGSLAGVLVALAAVWYFQS